MRHVRHPLSAIFGDMEEPALLALADDIRAKGILDPVVMYDGQVLDGWHRCLAGQIAEAEIPYVEYDGDDPGGFVISKNLHRRQRPLTASQRAAITVQCREWKVPHRTKKSAPGAGFSEADLAKEAEVSVRTIQHAKAAQKAGLSESVARGEISAKAAAEKVREQSGEPPKPRLLTEVEKLKAALAERDELIAELKESNQDLTDSLESQEDAKLDEDSAQVKFAQLRAYIRTLESQVREHQTRANEFMKEANRYRKRLGLKV